jgi:peptide chain release factor 1
MPQPYDEATQFGEGGTTLEGVMMERLRVLENEFRELEARLADPMVAADNRRYIELTRRYAALGDIVALTHDLRQRCDDVDTLKSLLDEADATERDELRAEAATAEAAIARLEEELKLLLLPKDPNDGRNVIVEIRGAEGGEEANLFARDLFTMYQGFAQSQGWALEVLASSHSDLGGFDEVTFMVKGDSAWTRMKFEAGPHRVQRVPVTESQGRIHTSSATVTVLPEADEVDVKIDPNDLQVDTYRSSGAGGQHVNTTDSAVRMTHLPTGLVVTMQDEKSQLQNRDRALKVLRARLLRLENDKQAADASAVRRGQTGGGGRSEKIRTYNFKENRVTDHRLGLTLHKLDRVLAGELVEISDALVQDERAHQLQDHAGPG